MLDLLSEIAARRTKHNIAVRVNNAAEIKIKQRHPWVFDNSIDSISHTGEAGDFAIIFDKNRKFLALGLWDPYSPIRVRILQHLDPVEINKNWFYEKIKESSDKRGQINQHSTNGYRLIHGENDGMPGLVLDRYDHVLVIKLYTLAWLPHLEMIINCLQEIFPYRSLVLRVNRKNETELRNRYGLKDGLIIDGEDFVDTVLFKENDLLFESQPLFGHKTGFYLDQRENRARVGKLAAGKDVLNMFAYNGGFSVYAARGGAKSVTSVDINPFAIDSAIRNFNHNFGINGEYHSIHNPIVENAFKYLQNATKLRQKFDMVILDPPMFAQNAKQVTLAIRNYKKLTRLALPLIKPNGVLVQASCSSRISSRDFFDAVLQEIATNGLNPKEIIQTSHPVDHPIGFPEGEYLKCLFATIL
jgi:23S rRNA (cytosine1962-C5)-methyltransferase